MVFVFSSFRLDVANARLQRGKQAICLTPKALNVLRYLIERAGELVTKDDLWRAVWPGVTVTDATLTVCVNQIRKALGDEAKTPRYIETVHRLGYRFIAPVSIASVPVSGTDLRGQSSLAASNSRSTQQFVGRERESTKLHRWLEQASRGERQIVFVTGEPGIGKTTLVEEFLRRKAIDEGDGLWIGRGQCIEHYGAGEAYLPLLDALGRLCRAPGGRRLLDLLDKHAPAWLVLLSSVLDPVERKRLQQRVAGATRERMLRELAEAVEIISQERPLVLLLEDLHWSDYSTLEWMGFLARRPEAARLLVLGTYRPVEVILREHPLKHVKHELQVHGQCKELPLPLLSESAVTEYLTRRFGARVESNSTSGQHPTVGSFAEAWQQLGRTIYQRTDGNPLFMVNLVDFLIEQEVLVTSGNVVGDQNRLMLGAERIGTPTSIVEMIELNLDRLNRDEQAVLEVASVAGAEFTIAPVAAALERSVIEVEACCARLSRRHLFVHLHGNTKWPDGTVAARFQFLHGLYREVLYDRIPAARRMELHHRIANCEQLAWGERVDEIAAELAHHYSEAGQIEAAIRYWGIAGRKAVKRSANIEAISQLSKAIEAAATLPTSADRLRERVRLQVTLISALTATKGYAAPEVEIACNIALVLCQQIPDSVELFAVLAGLGSLYVNRGQLRVAMELAQRMMRLAERSDRPSLSLWAHYAFGFILLHKAEYTQARNHLESCLELYDRERAGSYGFVQDPGPTALIALATAVYSLGYPDLALKRTSEALELAREISQPFTLAWALIQGGEILMKRGDLQKASALWDESVALCTTHDLTELLQEGVTRQGWVLIESGRPEEGLARLREGVAKAEDKRMDATLSQARLAVALSRSGQIDEGLRLITEVLAREAASEMGLRLAWLHQTKGELLLMRHSVPQAEACFRESITIARAQQDRAQELAATTRLARLLTKLQKKRVRTMLSAIYNQFIEGFDTADLRAAKLLLDQLNGK